jgi:hypothetical protein
MPLSKEERRTYEAGLDADMRSYRADETAPTRRPHCPAALGRPHDFSMRGSDGVMRCWHCCKTRAAVEAAR